MSFLLAEPQGMVAAAADIEAIGATLSAASAAAATPTSSLLAAAGDEVSAAIANLFGTFGSEYQDVVTQFEAFHNEFHR
ncbi:MAG: PE family protein, partial [Mycobacterium gordonae]|nr:PE family protein [Mycobacterium gordonae]